MGHRSELKEILEVFVSMPYGREPEAQQYWNSFYHHAVLNMKSLFAGRGYAINFIRADQHASALTVTESVAAQIDRCHMCLAVITGENPNVFWEMGYAEKAGKPVILVVEQDIKDHSPVLIAHKLRESYDGKMFDKEPVDDAKALDFRQRLLPYFDIAVKVVRGLERPAPQYRIFSDRVAALLPQAVIGADRTIDLITSNLSYFADEGKFSAAGEDGRREFAFDPPVKRDVRLRILALDPESVIAEYRAKQLSRGHDVAGYREELRSAARFFYQRYAGYKNVEIYIYDDLPLQITLIIDNSVITSFVSRAHQSRFNVHAQFDLDFKGARGSFEGHFAEVLASQAQTSHISRFTWAQEKMDQSKSVLVAKGGESG